MEQVIKFLWDVIILTLQVIVISGLVTIVIEKIKK